MASTFNGVESKKKFLNKDNEIQLSSQNLLSPKLN
jgi:hypothetical protein